MTKKIGFVGVGTMGKPMAHNLLKAGFPVTICAHVNVAPVKELAEAGAAVVANPCEVTAASETVVICLPNTAQVEEALFGVDGVMVGARPGLVVIDTSTIDPVATQRFAARLAEAGCHLLDCPMSGGQVGAINGTLTFMVGGDEATLEGQRDVLSAMGKKIYHLGGSGLGQVAKLCNNLMLGINLVGACEAFAFGVKAGADAAALMEVVQASSGGSEAIGRYFPRTVFKNQYKPGFMLKLMCKDLNLALAAAKELGVPTFAGATAGQVLDMVKATGKGDDDFTVVATLYQAVTGITIGHEE